jgi:hypothetical protein
MESRFQTSFIPKKPVVSEPNKKPKVVNLFAVLGTVIFILVLIASVGTFFYKSYLAKTIEAGKVQLEGEKKNLDPELVKKIVRLDNRFKAASVLFDQHLATSRIFDVLEKITLPSVRFKKFNFSYLGNDKVSLSMSGEATGFSAIALQSDVINDNPTFKEPIVGDLALESSGAVAFTMTANIDPSILYFKKYLNFVDTQTSTPPPAVPDTTATTSVNGQ